MNTFVNIFSLNAFLFPARYYFYFYLILFLPLRIECYMTSELGVRIAYQCLNEYMLSTLSCILIVPISVVNNLETMLNHALVNTCCLHAYSIDVGLVLTCLSSVEQPLLALANICYIACLEFVLHAAIKFFTCLSKSLLLCMR